MAKHPSRRKRQKSRSMGRPRRSEGRLANLSLLRTIDGLKEVPFPHCRCFLHEDHRWILPIICFAQDCQKLPRPCRLVGFDAHHDILQPRSLDEIKKISKRGVTVRRVIDLCKNSLRTSDDDWLKAGMELGLISDAVIFGVMDSQNNGQYEDHTGTTHRIELAWLPRSAFNHQGVLSDLARSDEFASLWEVLNWEYNRGSGFAFAPTSEKLLLDFDLDCFTVDWNDYRFPWLDEIFEREFYTESDYFTTIGWSGKKFLDCLVKRAGLITIARESECCGGSEKSAEILRKTNHYLFDGKLSL